MNVRIKEFAVEMEVKTKGIEFEIRTPQDAFVGDLIITKTQLIWCAGQTTRANGKKISLPDLVAYMQSLP